MGRVLILIGLFWLMPRGMIAWGGALFHCTDAKGRTILRSDSCRAGEWSANPQPEDETIPFLSRGTRGQYWIPVLVNGQMTVDFLIDTGANIVVLPQDIVDGLVASGSVKPKDWLGVAASTLADGSMGRMSVVRLESLRIGRHVLRNIAVSVTPAKSMPLLGTPVLEQLGAWRIDSKQRQLRIPFSPQAEATVEKPTAVETNTTGKVMRQCWREDGSSWLSQSSCPLGAESAPHHRQK
ncbi:MAG: clan AA aspartic protease [Magnetococcales bacterium]|nr:clan AA aspartic protease [Magnetococcales bacterium]